MITAWAVHRNENEYPDPEEYKPERFLPENKKEMNPYAFMTFGTGPRNCKLIYNIFVHRFAILIDIKLNGSFFTLRYWNEVWSGSNEIYVCSYFEGIQI